MTVATVITRRSFASLGINSAIPLLFHMRLLPPHQVRGRNDDSTLSLRGSGADEAILYLYHMGLLHSVYNDDLKLSSQ